MVVVVLVGITWRADPIGDSTAMPTAAVADTHDPVEKVHPPAPCAHPGPHDPVQGIAWDEIARLHSINLPVCDVIWSFGSLPDSLWGVTYADVGDELGRPLVVIEPSPAAYGDGLEQDVRTTVRHEFGHALTGMLGLDDTTLRAMFDAELGGVHLGEHTEHGSEAAAEAIAEALTPKGEERTWFYDRHVDQASVMSAQDLLASFVD
ncbi:hypothetical protein JN535_08795 [Cellulosimicrobium cellulans]|uniref:hypothetical protein n=1 Tax=Cellulosimicrobium cellulans TaxID=1710 RepID=UPI0019632162|nr:hypothetical protein [Cellulosimicrobium cellulans]MBN0040260.1 hypothetical protein [Cellulosimicrobium cellulans]